MVFTIKPGLVPSLERSLHWQIQEAATRAHLEANATNNLSFISTGLILQQEIAFEQEKNLEARRERLRIDAQRR
jgi:hypothetical protein